MQEVLQHSSSSCHFELSALLNRKFWSSLKRTLEEVFRGRFHRNLQKWNIIIPNSILNIQHIHNKDQQINVTEYDVIQYIHK